MASDLSPPHRFVETLFPIFFIFAMSVTLALYFILLLSHDWVYLFIFEVYVWNCDSTQI